MREHPPTRASELTPGRQPHHSSRVDQHQLLSLPKPGPPPQLGGENETPSLTEANRVGLRVSHVEDGTTRAGLVPQYLYHGTIGALWDTHQRPKGESSDFTALGDPVNVAAHLAAQAGAGEILVTTEAAAAAGLESTGLERRSLSLKGHPVGAVVLSASGAPKREFRTWNSIAARALGAA